MLENKKNTVSGVVLCVDGLRAGGDLFAEDYCIYVQPSSENDLDPYSSERRSAVWLLHKQVGDAYWKPFLCLPILHFDDRTAFVVLDVDDTFDPRPTMCHPEDGNDLFVVSIRTDECHWVHCGAGDAVDVKACRNGVRHVLSFVRDSANHCEKLSVLNNTLSLNNTIVNIGTLHA